MGGLVIQVLVIRDHIIPSSLNRKNFKRYAGGGGSVTEFKEFEDRSHTIIMQKGWETEAGFVLEWVRKNS